MSKTAERLKGYQTQMSIYAEQHKMILASDVLDMIEQLQDDLKDDADAVVAELEKLKSNKGFGGTLQTMYADAKIDDAIGIVKAGGAE